MSRERTSKEFPHPLLPGPTCRTCDPFDFSRITTRFALGHLRFEWKGNRNERDGRKLDARRIDGNRRSATQFFRKCMEFIARYQCVARSRARLPHPKPMLSAYWLRIRMCFWLVERVSGPPPQGRGHAKWNGSGRPSSVGST